MAAKQLQASSKELSEKQDTTKDDWLQFRGAVLALAAATQRPDVKQLVEKAGHEAAGKDVVQRQEALRKAVLNILEGPGLTTISLGELEKAWAAAPETVPDDLEQALALVDAKLLDMGRDQLASGCSHETAADCLAFMERLCSLTMQVTAVGSQKCRIATSPGYRECQGPDSQNLTLELKAVKAREQSLVCFLVYPT